MVAASAVVLVTVIVKVTEPPVSGTLVGSAVLVTVIAGSTSLKSTVALPLAVSLLPSLSAPVAVTVLL